MGSGFRGLEGMGGGTLEDGIPVCELVVEGVGGGGLEEVELGLKKGSSCHSNRKNNRYLND